MKTTAELQAFRDAEADIRKDALRQLERNLAELKAEAERNLTTLRNADTEPAPPMSEAV